MSGIRLLVVATLVLDWLLSSFISRGKGFVVFALLLIPLAVAVSQFLKGRRSPLYALLYLTLLASLAVLGLEATLRAKPDILGGQIANVALTGYHWQRGGIYDLDVHAGPVLRPSVSRPMYWNGHWWQHHTNARGFRGPEMDHAQAVFLGDSMIYGHGVDSEDTVASRFARVTGESTANLGQQGTFPLQAYMALLWKGLPLKPRVVFLALHFNDTEDAGVLYDDGELAGFADAPASSEALPRVRALYQPPPAWNPVWFWSRHVALPTEAGAALGAAVRAWRGQGTATTFAPRDPFVPTREEIETPFPGVGGEGSPSQQLAWRAQGQALARIKQLCDRSGARLVVFDLGYPNNFSKAAEAQVRSLGADYSPAGRAALARALAGDRVYLANDGHWTGAGAQVVAEELARGIGVKPPTD